MSDISRDSSIYAAALIDGEGTITLSKECSWSEFRYPVVSVPSTTPALVYIMKQWFGGTISNKRRSKAHHSDSKTWRVNHDRALQFLSLILPYMHEPEKIRRAKLLVEEYKAVTPRNGRYTGRMRQLKVDFERRFFGK